jgi:hypothetical protein
LRAPAGVNRGTVVRLAVAGKNHRAVIHSILAKTTLPVVANILVEATDRGIRLSGTDLDIAEGPRRALGYEVPQTSNEMALNRAGGTVQCVFPHILLRATLTVVVLPPA